MSTAKRLAALELAAEQAKAARIEENQRFYERVTRAVSPAARAALLDWTDTQEADPARAECIWLSVTEIARPLDAERAETVGRWLDMLEATPEDGTLPPAAPGTAEYLSAEAADWERAEREEAGDTEDTRRAARWRAARFRYFAVMAEMLGGGRAEGRAYGREEENFAWRLFFKLPNGVKRSVRALGDTEGMAKLYGGYREVERDFPPGEVSEAVALAAYRAAWGEA